MITERTITSPIGSLLITAERGAIVGVNVTRTRRTAVGSSPLITECMHELSEYFAGTRTAFTVPMKAEGTEFQRKVWNAMRTIPYGSTKTYAQIAKAIGTPTAVRAVGGACGKNPLLILTPCHRVIGSGGRPGGFSAGVSRKKMLLRREQVRG